MPDIGIPQGDLTIPSRSPVLIATRRRPWPTFAVRWRRYSLELEGLSCFLRLGRLEIYGRRHRTCDPRWAVIREPGSIEGHGFGLGLTASWSPVRAGGAA